MPSSKDKFQLQCDIPLKIKEYFKSEAKGKNTSLSSILSSNFKNYISDDGNWNLPEDKTITYDTYGDIGFNNLKFYIENDYRGNVDVLSKKRFTDYKGITKHFVYSLYFKLNS